MPDLVAIASGLDLKDAYLARAKLEGSGIRCFLANESLVGLNTWRPHLSSVVGGVELQVMRHDVPAAMEVLTGKEFDGAREPDAFAVEPCCPKCGSMQFTQKRRGRRRGILAFLFAVLLPVPRDRKTCKQCGHDWI
jgi:RNA polymerase subunit RPABC4/transcription elongation factor Spt4